MRTEDFTMERDVLNIGDTVRITEGKLPHTYYYTAEPAAAMSANFLPSDRIKSREGTVVSKKREGSSFIIGIAFEE